MKCFTTEVTEDHRGEIMSAATKPQLDPSTDHSLPNSRRIYIEGQQPQL